MPVHRVGRRLSSVVMSKWLRGPVYGVVPGPQVQQLALYQFPVGLVEYL